MNNSRLGVICLSLVVAGLVLMVVSLFIGLGPSCFVVGCLLILCSLLALVIWFDDQE